MDLTPVEGALAAEAVRAMGLSHAGIDILRTTRGPLIPPKVKFRRPPSSADELLDKLVDAYQD
jgi:hypothetical protein